MRGGRPGDRGRPGREAVAGEGGQARGRGQACSIQMPILTVRAQGPGPGRGAVAGGQHVAVVVMVCGGE